ncbi:MAG: GNAT family N-acetyltransferase [Methanomassiliicoccales archaeon]|nr:MAG: GNAT family N-acetyltransferase [Methanomassiliicoccales archaeon]
MTEIKISPLQPKEVDKAAEVLSKAFVNTPFTGKIVGGHTEKHRRLVQIGFKNMISKKPGEKVVAKDGDEIVGVMRMVKWPDCQNSIPRGLETIPIYIVARKVLGRLQEARKVWGVHDPKKPHWHVDPIGILPERQGQGIGGMLMKYYCERVDSEDMPAYHETDQMQNVRFYEKHGYKVIETEPIFGITNWFLWREPNGKREG